MKKNLSTLLLVLVFFVGLSVLLYPTISNYVNSKHQSHAIETYNETVSKYTPADFSAAFDAAEAYNARLRETDGAFYNPSQIPGYTEALNVGGMGVMGYISIEKLRVELPIYHSTDESILQVAVGHLEGSSLPVGGTGTHCVLSGHRGLPSAKLFTELDQMELGDTFTISVLDRVLTYQVDQIRIVLPSEVDDLQLVPGEDYCTLVTCTPYGINTHRLLVRGTRVQGTAARPQIYMAAEAYRIDPIITAPAVAAPILLVLLIVLLIKYRKKKA